MKLLKKYQNKPKKEKRTYNKLVEKSNNKPNNILNILALPKIQYSFDIKTKYLIENIINPLRDLRKKTMFIDYRIGASTQKNIKG